MVFDFAAGVTEFAIALLEIKRKIKIRKFLIRLALITNLENKAKEITFG